ncbi:Oidioi.mRNA.OKI2018_I69.PAR.g9518.t1.cds [Oikopleura dioica]|uniref:Oidioi.mRNA.OKI2018_I69.PAR.g9518.t1.cds n=1 Tax=Oikopleura dioica TaxID=34765 RepID=A0ABN7RL05_OIKDI|nr:Oidioi.mRNA.OKI2018_I69.PAR.g9518.t1.cds [Oikopleura dioica]
MIRPWEQPLSTAKELNQRQHEFPADLSAQYYNHLLSQYNQAMSLSSERRQNVKQIPDQRNPNTIPSPIPSSQQVLSESGELTRKRKLERGHFEVPLKIEVNAKTYNPAREEFDQIKVPHRLIEKKRRDRINNSIITLRDLLPLGVKSASAKPLEKAVVLEMTIQYIRNLKRALVQKEEKQKLHSRPARAVPEPPLSQFQQGYQSAIRHMNEMKGTSIQAELNQRLSPQIAHPPGSLPPLPRGMLPNPFSSALPSPPFQAMRHRSFTDSESSGYFTEEFLEEPMENNFGQSSFMPNLNQMRRMLEENEDASSEIDIDVS